jgi:hypothetical protein
MSYRYYSNDAYVFPKLTRMYLLRILAVLIILILFAMAFQFPMESGWVYIVLFVFIFQIWMVALPLFLWSRADTEQVQRNWPQLSDIEAFVVHKYAFHFAYPFASREYSATCAFLAMASFPMAAVLAYHDQWIQAAVVGVNFLVLGPLSHKLSPYNGLCMLAEKDATAIIELNAYENAMEKIRVR